MNLQIKKLHPDAKAPTYAHPGDAGMDMYAVGTTIVPAGQRAIISTGIAMAIPLGYVGLIWDKGGISNKFGLTVIGGVVDAGYRGEILIGIFNTSHTDYTFTAGDKVAQMVIQAVIQPTFTEVDELDETPRGEGRFGSTGI